MLCTRPVRLLGTEIFLHCLYGRVEDRHAGQIQFCTFAFQHMTQSRINQGREHNAGIGGDVLNGATKLVFAANQRVDMLARLGTVELRTDRFGEVIQCLTGRVGDHVEMIVTNHRFHPKRTHKHSPTIDRI